MKTIIIFDERSYKWDKDPDFNRVFLKQSFRHLEDLLKFQGYLYLNRVYEYLGMNWNPDNENICFRKENGPAEFNYELTEENTYKITITQ